MPTHIAAKIAVLCEMYPTKNLTQIVADLLTSSLDELKRNLPEGLGRAVENQHDYERIAEHLGEECEMIYYLGGAKGRFHELANRHYVDLEKELGNDEAGELFSPQTICASDLKATD